jgi:nucleoid-associated protein YgaU
MPDIAARKLGTGDGPRIATYWLEIYRHNLDVIGPNPDLVRPGQVLELPHE